MDVAPGTIVDLPARNLVGVEGSFIGAGAPNSNAHVEIPKIWNELDRRTHHLETLWPWSIGLMTPSDPTGAMTYVAAVNPTDVHVGVETLMRVGFAGGRYVTFEHRGSLDDFSKTAVWFYREFLPTTGVTIRPGYHVEIYDHRFSPHSDSSTVIIGAPIS